MKIIPKLSLLLLLTWSPGVQMYSKNCCNTIGVGSSISIGIGVDLCKMLKFYVKVLMGWARRCQVSHPVIGQLLFKTAFY